MWVPTEKQGWFVSTQAYRLYSAGSEQRAQLAVVDTFEIHKRWEMFWRVEWLAASDGGFWSWS
jgi:hypothetical protein